MLIREMKFPNYLREDLMGIRSDIVTIVEDFGQFCDGKVQTLRQNHKG